MRVNMFLQEIQFLVATLASQGRGTLRISHNPKIYLLIKSPVTLLSPVDPLLSYQLVAKSLHYQLTTIHSVSSIFILYRIPLPCSPLVPFSYFTIDRASREEFKEEPQRSRRGEELFSFYYNLELGRRTIRRLAGEQRNSINQQSQHGSRDRRGD